MVQYDQRVLNKLLDTYENSLLSTGENKRKIHIDLPFTKKTMREYFDESTTEYENIHAAMALLQQKGYLSVLWKGNKEGHLIDRLRMNVEAVDEIYAYVKRRPKSRQETDLLEALDSCECSGLEISGAFVRYLKDRIRSHQSVKEFIDLGKPAEAKRLLHALVSVEQNQEPCYIREFSIRHFQDSKYFEQVKNTIVRILQRFHAEYANLDEAEILSEYGIYHTPNYVYLKGNVTLTMAGEPVMLYGLKQGLGISGDDLSQIAFSDVSHIKKVITIENLTTYFRWQEENSLIIYLGGYHNAIRRSLLRKIHEAVPGAAYLHFGDIDAGGFAIYQDLRRKTGIEFRLYHMDLDTLKRYEQYGKPLTASDKKRLTEWQGQDAFADVVQYMLLHNVKLEQECVEIGDGCANSEAGF